MKHLTLSVALPRFKITFMLDKFMEFLYWSQISSKLRIPLQTEQDNCTIHTAHTKFRILIKHRCSFKLSVFIINFKSQAELNSWRPSIIFHPVSSNGYYGVRSHHINAIGSSENVLWIKEDSTEDMLSSSSLCVSYCLELISRCRAAFKLSTEATPSHRSPPHASSVRGIDILISALIFLLP